MRPGGAVGPVSVRLPTEVPLPSASSRPSPAPPRPWRLLADDPLGLLAPAAGLLALDLATATGWLLAVTADPAPRRVVALTLAALGLRGLLQALPRAVLLAHAARSLDGRRVPWVRRAIRLVPITWALDGLAALGFAVGLAPFALAAAVLAAHLILPGAAVLVGLGALLGVACAAWARAPLALAPILAVVDGLGVLRAVRAAPLAHHRAGGDAARVWRHAVGWRSLGSALWMVGTLPATAHADLALVTRHLALPPPETP